MKSIISRRLWPLKFAAAGLRSRVPGMNGPPLLAGFKITAGCNLRCLHCPFISKAADNQNRELTLEDVDDLTAELARDGVLLCIFEGGEPFSWRDGGTTIHDVAELAADRFLSVGISTNGTFPLDAPVDTIWVSVDGLADTHDRIRGSGVFDLVMKNLDESAHPNLYANICINELNREEIPALVETLAPLVKGITIQFHYPYDSTGEADPLYTGGENRIRVLDRLASLKRDGYPVADSFDCLEALKAPAWRCRDRLLVSVEPDGTIRRGCYVKGRGKINCRYCGFAAHAELSLAFDLHPGPFLAGRKIFRYGAPAPRPARLTVPGSSF